MAQPINDFNVPVHQRPRYLFFVQHASSRSRINNNGGFEAADTSTTPHDLAHLQWLIMNHVNWACRVPSCFISTFGSFDQAIDWGMQRDRPATIHRIDTRNIDLEVLIFRALHFTSNCFGTEYLFLHGIPGYAIVRQYHVPDAEICKLRVHLIMEKICSWAKGSSRSNRETWRVSSPLLMPLGKQPLSVRKPHRFHA